MTKEQEAIKTLYKDLELAKKENSIDIDVFTFNLETALSMLKEKDTEIEQKNTELEEKNAEIEQKEKQIDLMAITIIQRDIGKNYCQFDKKCCKCEDGSRDFNCKNCIKRYYEGQVKE